MVSLGEIGITGAMDTGAKYVVPFFTFLFGYELINVSAYREGYTDHEYSMPVCVRTIRQFSFASIVEHGEPKEMVGISLHHLLQQRSHFTEKSTPLPSSCM